MATDKVLHKIELIRQKGFRPCVIAALICGGKVGLFKSHYPGYEFVQGGIEFGETPQEAMEREVMEELGHWFYQGCNFPPEKFIYLLEAKMETKVKEALVTEKGETIKPVGKYYLVFAALLRTDGKPSIKPEDFQFSGSTVKFHAHVWADYDEAKRLIETITNPIKRDIALKSIEMLKARGLI